MHHICLSRKFNSSVLVSYYLSDKHYQNGKKRLTGCKEFNFHFWVKMLSISMIPSIVLLKITKILLAHKEYTSHFHELAPRPRNCAKVEVELSENSTSTKLLT